MDEDIITDSDQTKDELGYFAAILIFLLVLFSTEFPNLIPYLASVITSHLCKETEAESKLRKDVTTLRKELKQIHMVDEFAKYAKTERKINKLLEEIKVFDKTRSDFMSKVKLILRSIFQVMKILLTGCLLWCWKSYPVLIFDSCFFSPVSSLVSFPSQVPGGIGLIPWLLMCRVVITKGSAYIHGK